MKKIKLASQGWEHLGTIPVDSGQVLLIDPCHVDEHWTNTEFEDIRKYRNRHTGKVLQYLVDFGNYEDVIPEYGTTMNELNRSGDWEPMQNVIPPGLNYNTCSMTTLQDELGGIVDSMAVAVMTGWGDGLYPVYVKRGEEGRIMQVMIDFERD